MIVAANLHALTVASGARQQAGQGSPKGADVAVGHQPDPARCSTPRRQLHYRIDMTRG